MFLRKFAGAIFLFTSIFGATDAIAENTMMDLPRVRQRDRTGVPHFNLLVPGPKQHKNSSDFTDKDKAPIAVLEMRHGKEVRWYLLRNYRDTRVEDGLMMNAMDADTRQDEKGRTQASNFLMMIADLMQFTNGFYYLNSYRLNIVGEALMELKESLALAEDRNGQELILEAKNLEFYYQMMNPIQFDDSIRVKVNDEVYLSRGPLRQFMNWKNFGRAATAVGIGMGFCWLIFKMIQ